MGDASVRVAFETARLRLSQILAEGHEARQAAYRSACEHSARTLNVERVSIWFLGERGDTLLRALQYTLSDNSFGQGGQLQRQGADRYFAALTASRVVAASDAIHDPRTSQLEDYLRGQRVSALLDAPIYRDGRVVGVVCHEHVGGVREWTEREAGFASAVADLLTILIDQAERAELRAALDAQREAAAQRMKLEALVRLARVVVHDLAIVLLVASMRAGESETDDNPREASREVVDVLAYGNKLLGQLRTFCNPRTAVGPAEVEAVNLLRGMEGALLSVKDNGCGMDETAQLGIFEPFYTTKPGHSGVGLSAVYGIVERAHGRITLTSAPGQGTTFLITLPMSESLSHAEPPWAF
jgi:signal transduction histidine kinase